MRVTDERMLVPVEMTHGEFRYTAPHERRQTTADDIAYLDRITHSAVGAMAYQ